MWGSAECCYCVPYCPVGAIIIKKGFPYDKGFIVIDEEKCVECGVCLRFYSPSRITQLSSEREAGSPGHDVIFQQELSWPRTLRYMFSDPCAAFPETDILGRGTEEMKTNDVTHMFKAGEVGIGIELGRPGIGASFKDVEKVTEALAKHDVEFAPRNPVTFLIDTKTGRLKNPSVRKETVLSAIVELIAVSRENLPKIIETLRRVSKEINTVMSVEVITMCEDGRIPIMSMLEEAGVNPRINGKMNLGLAWSNK